MCQVNKDNEVNIKIVILRDSDRLLCSTPKLYCSTPRVVEDIINGYNANRDQSAPEVSVPHSNKKESKTSNTEVFVYQCNSHGAAHSLYNIRKILLDNIGIINATDDDIAILLDDDDMLASPDVVKKIVDRMDKRKAHICLTQFESIGEQSLNIVNQAGRIHNSLIDTLSKQEDTIAPCSSPEPFGEGALCFADSLGWTKVYRIKVIKEYHDNLKKVFNNSERKLKCFLRKNDAFEDFPEIINLCRENYKTTVLATKTHKYRKHPRSVTATPCEKDFKYKRTAYLTLLMRLYRELNSDNNKKLRPCSAPKKIIARYFTIKILTIENILAKFRTNVISKRPHNGEFFKWLLEPIRDITSYRKNRWLRESEQGSFVEWLLESLKSEGLLNDFLTLLNNNTKPTELPKYVVKSVCAEEAKRGIVDLCHCFGDKSTRFQSERINKIVLRLGFFIGIIAITILLAIIASISTVKSTSNYTALSAIVAAAVGVCGWAATNIYRINADRVQEDKLTDMFGNAVDDLIRHIVAGYMVLYKIQQDMLPLSTHSKKPAKVHFSNLKVSQQSLLMSDEFDNNLVVQEFKNLPRLRVNIRNINNSAEYMERYLDDSAYDPTHMYNIIEWEMNRYMGYFVNFMFFKENNMFRFPDETEREIFLKTHQLYNHFAKIACSNHPDYPKLIRNLKLEERYKAYKEDRGDNRKVLIF